MKKHYDRIYAAIDLDAITHNMEVIHQKLPRETKLFAVVKTDGYGHGAVPLALELEPKDFMFGFATATAEEALILRKAGITKPILVLGYVFPYAYEAMVKENIRLTVFREDMLEELNREAARQGKKAPVHIKADTGMSRIGIRPEESGIAFVRKVKECKWLEPEGIFTHFAKADSADKSHAYTQFERFRLFCGRVENECGIKIPLKHCANSAAALEMPETAMELARAGIAMYGLWPSEEMRKEAHDLKPAFSLHSHVVYVKTLEAGEAVSYGGTYVTAERTKVATIPVGYGDGYPRALSNKGWVLIRGRKAPILGRVCMDQFMVDVTHIPDVREGDEVVLIGAMDKEVITMEELGETADRFNYELVCDIGKRVPRIYYKEGRECYAKDYFNDYRVESL